jgi:hypothetical protein
MTEQPKTSYLLDMFILAGLFAVIYANLEVWSW